MMTFPYVSPGRLQSEFWLEQKEMQGQVWIGVNALLLRDTGFFWGHNNFFKMLTSWTR